MDRGYIVVYLISHPYGWLISPLFRHCNPYNPLLSTPIRQKSIQQLIGQLNTLIVIRQLDLLIKIKIYLVQHIAILKPGYGEHKLLIYKLDIYKGREKDE